MSSSERCVPATFYRASWCGITKRLNVQSGRFEQRAHSWRRIDEPSSAFGYKRVFNGSEAPGFATEQEAVASWVQRREAEIAYKRDTLARMCAELEQVRDEWSLTPAVPADAEREETR